MSGEQSDVTVTFTDDETIAILGTIAEFWAQESGHEETGYQQAEGTVLRSAWDKLADAHGEG